MIQELGKTAIFAGYFPTNNKVEIVRKEKAKTQNWQIFPHLLIYGSGLTFLDEGEPEYHLKNDDSIL